VPLAHPEDIMIGGWRWSTLGRGKVISVPGESSWRKLGASRESTVRI